VPHVGAHIRFGWPSSSRLIDGRAYVVTKTRQSGKCRTRSSGISMLCQRAGCDEPLVIVLILLDLDAVSLARDNRLSSNDVMMMNRDTTATRATHVRTYVRTYVRTAQRSAAQRNETEHSAAQRSGAERSGTRPSGAKRDRADGGRCLRLTTLRTGISLLTLGRVREASDDVLRAFKIATSGSVGAKPGVGAGHSR
jgi:hypothetical protein